MTEFSHTERNELCIISLISLCLILKTHLFVDNINETKKNSPFTNDKVKIVFINLFCYSKFILLSKFFFVIQYFFVIQDLFLLVIQDLFLLVIQNRFINQHFFSEIELSFYYRKVIFYRAV